MIMDDPKSRVRNPALRLFDCLLQLYPPRFRCEFSAEIYTVFLSRMHEAEQRGGLACQVVASQEITGLLISILREGWNEFRNRKEIAMTPEDQPQKHAGVEGDMVLPLQTAGAPGLLWFAIWIMLTTAAIPTAFIAMAPLSVVFMGLLNQGVIAGFWPAAHRSILMSLGFVTGLAIALSAAQWYLLRNFLQQAWLWCVTTCGGVLLGGLVAGFILAISTLQSWVLVWSIVAVLLSFGLTLGLVQWHCLRRLLPNAFWIIVIDVLAAASILLVGRPIASYVHLAVGLVLPGVITGGGLMLLLSVSPNETPSPARMAVIQEKRGRSSRLVWIGVGVVVLIPLFFAFIWMYAASHLALAKNEGIYPSVQEAVIERTIKGWDEAEVVSIQKIKVGPNRGDGVQPHVWFGSAWVHLDRVPQDLDKPYYLSGSFYLRVREGWVHIPEDAFPEFIGWVMELYNMEGVNEGIR
jgi:hypothetical protein